MASASPSDRGAIPPNIRVFAESAEEFDALRQRIAAPDDAQPFLSRVTTILELGTCHPLWGRLVVYGFMVAVIAGMGVLTFCIATERLTPKGNEAKWLGLATGVMTLLILHGFLRQLMSRHFLLLSPDALGQCRGWRWRKNMRVFLRADIQHFAIFRVMRTSSGSKGRSSRKVQAAWGVRMHLADHTTRMLGRADTGLPLEKEYDACRWLGRRLAEWAGVTLMDEDGNVAADYSPRTPEKPASEAGTPATPPPRIRLYPSTTPEGRLFAAPFQPHDDAAVFWPPANAMGVAVSPPPCGFMRGLGLSLCGLIAPAILAAGWWAWGGLWKNKEILALLILVPVTGVFALVAFVGWLSAVMAAVSRVAILLTPEAAYIRSGWPGRRVNVCPRDMIRDIDLAKAGHGGTADERRYVVWRLRLVGKTGRPIPLLNHERDHGVAAWLNDLLIQWFAS